MAEPDGGGAQGGPEDGDGGTSDDDRQPDDAGQSGTLDEHLDDDELTEEYPPHEAFAGTLDPSPDRAPAAAEEAAIHIVAER